MSYEARVHAAIRSSLHSAYKVEINMARVPMKFRRKIRIQTEDAKGDRKKDRALLLPSRPDLLALIMANTHACVRAGGKGRGHINILTVSP